MDEKLALQQIQSQKERVTEVAPDLACLQFPMVNVFLVGARGAGDRSWALVDTGMPTALETIAREAEKRFGAGSRPSAILLTHGHFDHIGSVRQLAERWDAPVYAHPLEMPYLTGRSSYPPQDPTVGGGAIARVASRLFPKSPIDLGARVQTLPPDGSVPGMPGWRWIHTPGHTPGHVSFFRDSDRALIAGDAVVTVRQESALAVMSRRQEVWRPPAYFTPDWVSARSSVETIASLQPEILATGHGVPMRGEAMRRGLAELSRNFDRYIPAHGRYVGHPARADESGVVELPPPVADPLPLMVAGVGALALLGTALRGRSRPAAGPRLVR